MCPVLLGLASMVKRRRTRRACRCAALPQLSSPPPVILICIAICAALRRRPLGGLHTAQRDPLLSVTDDRYRGARDVPGVQRSCSIDAPARRMVVLCDLGSWPAGRRATPYCATLFTLIYAVCGVLKYCCWLILILCSFQLKSVWLGSSSVALRQIVWLAALIR